jgi:hypothetical protein
MAYTKSGEDRTFWEFDWLVGREALNLQGANCEYWAWRIGNHPIGCESREVTLEGGEGTHTSHSKNDHIGLVHSSRSYDPFGRQLKLYVALDLTPALNPFRNQLA